MRHDRAAGGVRKADCRRWRDDTMEGAREEQEVAGLLAREGMPCMPHGHECLMLTLGRLLKQATEARDCVGGALQRTVLLGLVPIWSCSGLNQRP